MVDTQGKPSGKGLRSVSRSTSPDMIHWSEPLPMTYTGTERVPSAQLYTNMTEPYFRPPHIYIAFPMRFMEGQKVVPDSQTQDIGLGAGRNSDSSNGLRNTTAQATRGRPPIPPGLSTLSRWG